MPTFGQQLAAITAPKLQQSVTGGFTPGDSDIGVALDALAAQGNQNSQYVDALRGGTYEGTFYVPNPSGGQPLVYNNGSWNQNYQPGRAPASSTPVPRAEGSKPSPGASYDPSNPKPASIPAINPTTLLASGYDPNLYGFPSTVEGNDNWYMRPRYDANDQVVAWDFVSPWEAATRTGSNVGRGIPRDLIDKIQAAASNPWRGSGELQNMMENVLADETRFQGDNMVLLHPELEVPRMEQWLNQIGQGALAEELRGAYADVGGQGWAVNPGYLEFNPANTTFEDWAKLPGTSEFQQAMQTFATNVLGLGVPLDWDGGSGTSTGENQGPLDSSMSALMDALGGLGPQTAQMLLSLGLNGLGGGSVNSGMSADDMMAILAALGGNQGVSVVGQDEEQVAPNIQPMVSLPMV